MPQTIQEFLADAAQKASADLTEAFLRIPEEKRNWSPGDKARTALNQFAECVLLNAYTAETIAIHKMGDGRMENYHAELAKVMALDGAALQAQFEANTAQVVAAIRAVPDEDLDTAVAMPWRPMTVTQIIAYPHWNLTYHEGQINYIASILGCLD